MQPRAMPEHQNCSRHAPSSHGFRATVTLGRSPLGCLWQASSAFVLSFFKQRDGGILKPSYTLRARDQLRRDPDAVWSSSAPSRRQSGDLRASVPKMVARDICLDPKSRQFASPGPVESQVARGFTDFGSQRLAIVAQSGTGSLISRYQRKHKCVRGYLPQPG